MEESYICRYCGKIFNTSHGKSYHENRCFKNPKSIRYTNLKKVRTCEKCGRKYTLEYQNSTERFCSRSCANTRQHSFETKTKISESVLGYCKSHPKEYPFLATSSRFCSVCGKELCKRNKTGFCRTCVHLKPVSEETRLKLSKAGRASAHIQKESRRSKIEALFFEEVVKLFSDAEANKIIADGWDTDVFIPSLNLTIFWNGKCHYYPIYGIGSLNQTQNRDRIKEKLFKDMGFHVYIIRDVDNEYPKDIRKSQKGRVLYQINRLLFFIKENLQ